jgi:hypothetical protein
MTTQRTSSFQFGLRSLFVLILIVAMALGAWVVGGVVAAIASLPFLMLLAMLAVEVLSIVVAAVFSWVLDPY